MGRNKWDGQPPVGVRVTVGVAVRVRVGVRVGVRVDVTVGDWLPQTMPVRNKLEMLASQPWKAASPGSHRSVWSK